MTDRFKGLTVTFERDIREDDAECIINAIRMVKGVASVDPLVADHTHHVARTQLRFELERELRAAIVRVFSGESAS